MKKVNTSPISGMQELLPAKAAIFNRLKKRISDVYSMHGFLSIETPIIERCEILLAKAGGDTEKQIYKVVKTAETEDASSQALRFDHTVPLARYVVQHENDLVFPFKVSQIGRNFRGERAQRGRFREFYQCDIDVIGREDLPIAYDAEIIATLLDAFLSFGLEAEVRARINNRKILSGLLEALALDEKTDKIFSIVDHAEKVTEEETKKAFAEIGLNEEQTAKLSAFINLHGTRAFVIKNLNNLGIDNELYKEGVMELDRVLQLLELDERGESVQADMKIVRGLDYYTGTVFEFNLPDYPQVGSVCGGGRYENLAGHFTEQKLPGVGGSIGLTRLFYVLNENNLIKSQEGKPVEFAVVPISENEIEFAFKVARELREEKKTVTIVLTDKKLSDKLKYAGNVAKKAIIIGETEVQSGTYEIKELH